MFFVIDVILLVAAAAAAAAAAGGGGGGGAAAAAPTMLCDFAKLKKSEFVGTLWFFSRVPRSLSVVTLVNL